MFLEYDIYMSITCVLLLLYTFKTKIMRPFIHFWAIQAGGKKKVGPPEFVDLSLLQFDDSLGWNHVVYFFDPIGLGFPMASPICRIGLEGYP